MALNGMFLGGFAQGFQDQTKIDLQQQQQQQSYDLGTKALQIQQQGQENAQKRADMARIDKIREDALSGITSSAQSLKMSGADDTKIYKALGPWIDQLKKLTKSSGLDPAFVDAQVAGAISTPPDPAKMAQLTKPVKSGQGLMGDEQYTQFNPVTQKYEPMQQSGGPPADTQPSVAPSSAQPATQLNTPPQSSGGISTPMTPKASAIVQSAGMTPETFDFNALRYAYGDTSAIQGFSSSKSGGILRTITKARAAQYWIDKGADAQTANNAIAEFQAMKSGARTIGNLEGRMTAALEKAKATAPVVLDISNKIDRTEFPTINSLILQAKKGTGDPNVVRLGIALETLVSNYGSALGMGTSALTDFQTKRAQELLERGYSQGQMQAAVDQMLVEMDRELAGNKRALRTFLGTSTQSEPSASPSSAAPAPGVNQTSTGVPWSIVK